MRKNILKIIQLNKMNTRIFFTLVILIYVFNISHPIWNEYGIKYNFAPDSQMYIDPGSFDPWKTYRTPGYPLICALFFSQEDRKIMNKSLHNNIYTEFFGKNRKVEKVLSDNGLDVPFSSLVLFQRIIQAIAVSLFFFALCEFFTIVISLCALAFSFWVTPLANPYEILTEPITQALIFMCLACIFLYKSKKNFLWLYMATILSLVAWSIRPVCLFMIGICGACCLFFCYKDHFHHKLQYCINLGLLILLPASYIAYLSIPVGGLLVSTVQDQTDLGRALFFLEREDLENMPTKRSKLFAQAYLDNYSKFVPEYEREFKTDLPDRWSSSRSLAYRYLYLSNPIIYVGSRYPYEVLRKDKRNGSLNTILGRNKFVKEFHKGVMKRHFCDNIKLTIANFFCGFGCDEDLPISKITNKFTLKIYVLGLLVLVAAIIISKKTNFPIILLVLVHLGNLVVCATHHPESRYINFTEIFMALALLLASFTLMKKSILFSINLIKARK